MFQEFGDDVKKFITLNEPKETSIQGKNIYNHSKKLNNNDVKNLQRALKDKLF